MTVHNASLPASRDPAVNQRRVEEQLNRIIAQVNADVGGEASDTEAGLIEIAVQSEMESATDTLKAVVPGRMKYHPGVPKFVAVVNVSAGTHSLVSGSSYGVTSVTDGATGIFTVNLATAFSSADWCCIATAEGSGTAVASARVVTVSSKSTTSVVVSTYNLAATPALADSVSISVVGYGDQ